MPPDEVILLKLVWHPDDIDKVSNMVNPAAFRRDDLTGQHGAHISVDRSDMAKRACMETLADEQAKKANGRDILREQAKIVELGCEAVRSSEHQGTRLFSVSSFPKDGNPAHCGIHSNAVVPRRGSAMDQMRGELAKLSSPPADFDKVYAQSR